MKNLLPESQESEQVILSNLLSDRTGEAFDVCSKLKPYHFLGRSHSIIFESMLNLIQDSKSTDLVSITDHLIKNSKLEEIGGHSFLNKLFSSYLTTAHSSQHVEILIEKYRLRKIVDICEKAQMAALNNSDSQDCLSSLESEIFDLTENEDSNENQLQNGCDGVQRQIEARRKGGDITGLNTGVIPFDNVFSGLQNHQMYIIAGIPSAGKTAMVDQMVGNLLMKNKNILYVSLESDRNRVIGKLACKLADVSFWDFIKNQIKKEELDRVEKFVQILRTKNLVLMRPFDISPMEIRPLIRKCKRRHEIDLVVVDYLQKFSMPTGWDERRTVSRASTEIQRACVETGVPAIVLCQLNRDAQEGARPSMRMLKESSQIEQDADNIALIWSPKSKREFPRELVFFPCVLSVDKNKDGASGIDEGMEFNLPKMYFKQGKL